MPPFSPEIFERLRVDRSTISRDLSQLPLLPTKVDRQEQLRTFFDMQDAAGQVGGDMGDAAMSGAQAAAPMVGDAAQAGASAAMSGAQAAAPVIQDAASGAANAVMSGAQAAAPMVGDAATTLASNLGDAASNLGGDDNGCFPANAAVIGRMGPIRMEDVRLGDELQCQEGFSPVIAMLHRSGTKMTYLRIHHEHGSLAVSADHLVYTCHAKKGTEARVWRWAPAARLRCGDMISMDMEATSVLNLSISMESGVFAPLTLNGTLLVDGILCSCFSPPQDLSLSHELCHRAMLPLRLWHMARRTLEASTTLCSGAGKESLPVLTLEAWSLIPSRDPSLHPYADALLSLLRYLRRKNPPSTKC